MIDFGKSYSPSWRLMRVDPETWADSEEVGRMLSASVERDSTSDLIESGSFEVDSKLAAGEFWGRLEMLAEQGGEVERHAVATLLIEPGKETVDMGDCVTSCDGRSVLAPAEDRKLLAGDYAPQGADGAAYAAGLIAKCTPAPVIVEGSFALSDDVVFAQGTSHLEAARMILDPSGWEVRISGDGTVRVRPMPTEPSLVLGTDSKRMLGTTVGREASLAEVPNRYIAVDGPESAVAVDDDPASPTSLVSRGRYVDYYDESPQPTGGESLQMYAERRLAEETACLGTEEYEREWAPDVVPGDIVRGFIAEIGMEGDSRVVSQSVDTSAGARVTERAEVLR